MFLTIVGLLRFIWSLNIFNACIEDMTFNGGDYLNYLIVAFTTSSSVLI